MRTPHPARLSPLGVLSCKHPDPDPDIDDKIHAQNVGLYFVYMMEQQHGAFYGLNDIDNDAIHRSDSNSYNSLNCQRVEKIGCVL